MAEPDRGGSTLVKEETDYRYNYQMPSYQKLLPTEVQSESTTIVGFLMFQRRLIRLQDYLFI